MADYKYSHARFRKLRYDVIGIEFTQYAVRYHKLQFTAFYTTFKR